MKSDFPRNWSITALVVTTLMVAGIFVYLENVRRRMNEIKDGDFPFLQALSSLSHAVDTRRSEMQSLIRDYQEKQVDDLRFHRYVFRDLVTQSHDRVGVELAGELSILAVEKIFETEDRILALLENGKQAAAAALYASEYLQENIDFQDRIRSLSDRRIDRRGAELAGMQRWERVAIFSLLGVFALAIGLWGIIFWRYQKNVQARVDGQKLLEDERARTVQMEKLSSLGEMAGSIAHEINNPLTVINGYADVLMSNIDSGNVDAAIFKDGLQKIFLTAERIGKITKALRTFARDSRKDPFEKVNLKELVDDVTAMMSDRLMKKQVEFKRMSFQDVWVDCKRIRIEQVLINLVGNAIDAIENLPSKWIELTYSYNGDFVCIMITDSGGGIPDEIADKLMEAFFTTKPVGKGTGLGLSVASTIASEHGGQLVLDRKHKHTRFVLEFPLKAKTAATPETSSAA